MLFIGEDLDADDLAGLTSALHSGCLDWVVVPMRVGISKCRASSKALLMQAALATMAAGAIGPLSG